MLDILALIEIHVIIKKEGGSMSSHFIHKHSPLNPLSIFVCHIKKLLICNGSSDAKKKRFFCSVFFLN